MDSDDDIREILPGLLPWTTLHDAIGAPVSSYFVVPAGAVVDPRVPAGGLDALAERGAPRQVILTTGLHARHAGRFAEAFGCPIRASRAAAERIGDALEIETFSAPGEIAPGITAIAIGVLAPDETALHVDVAEGAIAFADAVHHYGGALGFFPDELLGEDPEAVKEGLRDAFRGLLARHLDHLLFAHGDPVLGGGKAALRAFAAGLPPRA